MKTPEEILKSKGITETTKHHSYEYLFKSMKEAIIEYSHQKDIINITHHFIEEDLDNCWQYYKQYLIDILNYDYDLNKAREDLFGLVGSKFDKRIKNEFVCIRGFEAKSHYCFECEKENECNIK